MQLRTNAFLLCVFLTAADCSWDAPPNSDFITSGAGESVARSEVSQAREIWPTDSVDRDIVFDAERLLAPGAAGAAPAPLGDSNGSTSAAQ